MAKRLTFREARRIFKQKGYTLELCLLGSRYYEILRQEELVFEADTLSDAMDWLELQ